MVNKILRWLYYGVVLSVLPFTLVLIRNLASNKSVPMIDYFLDLLLITFAVAVNALNIVTDKAKQMSEVMRTACKILSNLSVIFCIAMYFSFFEYCYLNDKLLEQFMQIDISVENSSLDVNALREFRTLKKLVGELSPKNEQLMIFIIISVIILITNSSIGIVVEAVDVHRRKKQHDDQNKSFGNRNTMQNNIQSNYEN